MSLVLIGWRAWCCSFAGGRGVGRVVGREMTHRWGWDGSRGHGVQVGGSAMHAPLTVENRIQVVDRHFNGSLLFVCCQERKVRTM